MLTKREVIMDSVLQDINYACKYIRGGKDELVSRYAALALKSRICLFEGTYRKYHAVNPSTNQPWQETDGARKYLRACVDASEVCSSRKSQILQRLSWLENTVPTCNLLTM